MLGMMDFQVVLQIIDEQSSRRWIFIEVIQSFLSCRMKDEEEEEEEED